MSKNPCDVIVVGAGLGGLTIAALLAQKGVHVVVLDQHYVVGGCASSFRRHRYVFDAAVHLVGGMEEGGLIHGILSELNLLDQLQVEAISPMYKVQVGQDTYDIPADPDRLADLLIRMSPADEEAILDTIQEFKEVGKAVISTGEISKRVQGRIMALQNISIRQYLEDRFIHSKVEFLLTSLYPYIGAMPSEIPAPLYMGAIMSYQGGGFYVHGSWQNLSNVLRDSIERNGGKVILNRRVEQILLEDGKVAGVRDHKGNVYAAPLVYSNVDIRKTYLDMVGKEHIPTPFAEELQSLTPSLSAIILYAAIRNDGWEQGLAHEMFLYPNYQNQPKINAYHPLDPHSKPWLSISCPTHVDASLAPEGHSIVSFIAPCDGVAMEQIRQEKGKEFLLDTYLDLLESYVPGLRERIVYSELATPRTVERFTGNGNGSIYGWKKSYDQQKRLAMISRSIIPGLHVVGHWTKHGHGVFGVMNAGRHAAIEFAELKANAR